MEASFALIMKEAFSSFVMGNHSNLMSNIIFSLIESSPEMKKGTLQTVNVQSCVSHDCITEYLSTSTCMATVVTKANKHDIVH